MEEFPLIEARDELRTELLAVLNASRELDPRVDSQLADVFLHRVETIYRLQAPPRAGRAGGRFLGPLLGGVALLAFFVGAMVSGFHHHPGLVSPRFSPAYHDTHHFWNAPQGPDSGRSGTSSQPTV